MIKKYQKPGKGGITYTKWGETPTAAEEWADDWRFRTTPAARSKVMQKWKATGKKPKPETSEEYTERRKKEETKRTWRSDVADILHGVGEGVLALHPYTAIPYYGAKVGEDFLNGNVSWQTALHASVPLLHLSPEISKGTEVVKNVVSDVNRYRSPVYKMTKSVINNPQNNKFNWRNYKFLGDKRFYQDVDKYGIERLLKMRSVDNYPLTYPERYKFVKQFKNDTGKGINYSISEGIVNTNTKLSDQWIFDENTGDIIVKPRTQYDIEYPKTYYGSRKASNVYGAPSEEQYTAFYSKNDGVYFPFRNNTNKSLTTNSGMSTARDRIQTGAHEARHHVQNYFEVPLVRRQTEIPNAYNEYTNIELPKEFVDLVDSYIKESGTRGTWQGSLSEMDAELSGWLAEYNLPRYSEMLPKEKALIHDLFQRRFGGNSDYKNYGEISTLLRQNPNEATASDYAKILDDSKIGKIIQGLEQLGYRKQGGKMNIINFLKNGSGIHIKKKNRGKFTDYCGGKVTNACIKRAKASGNPTLVKRATFAANARKWKHANGGKLADLINSIINQ